MRKLKQDGTVLTTGHGGARQCEISIWSNINAIKAYSTSSLRLCADDTLISTSVNSAVIKHLPKNVLEFAEYDDYMQSEILINYYI